MKHIYSVLSMILLGLVIASTQTLAYETYNPPGPEVGCADCHIGFVRRGPLHSMHVGNSQMTNTCELCHVNNGDNPSLSTSGAANGQGCRGCHGVDNGTQFGWGAGLREHHAQAGAPADADGLFCADCHSGDPAPSPESTLPVYYSLSDVNVKQPCDETASDGEDIDGDGFGLDNDGDLAYDSADSDCGSQTAVPGGDGAVFSRLTLGAPVPNPVRAGNAEIGFFTPEAGPAEVRVFNLSGREVADAKLVQAHEGWNRFRLDMARVGDGRPVSGIYWVQVSWRGEQASTKIVLTP